MYWWWHIKNDGFNIHLQYSSYIMRPTTISISTMKSTADVSTPDLRRKPIRHRPWTVSQNATHATNLKFSTDIPRISLSYYKGEFHEKQFVRWKTIFSIFNNIYIERKVCFSWSHRWNQNRKHGHGFEVITIVLNICPAIWPSDVETVT